MAWRRRIRVGWSENGLQGVERFERDGERGLTDRSRRPYRYANQLPTAVETLIVRLKKHYPH